jgi:hypothetical protein
MDGSVLTRRTATGTALTIVPKAPVKELALVRA